MRLFLVKLLSKLLYPYDLASSSIDKERMDEFLLSLQSTENGYKDYYTVRKRAISDTISTGLEQKEYWINIGRIAELRQMNAMSAEILRKQTKEEKKANKRGEEAKKK